MKEIEQNSIEIGVKAKKAFYWVASTSAIWQIISWSLTLITARILLPKDFGIAALPGTFIPYLTLVAGLRLETWIVQRKAWDVEIAKSIRTFSFLLGIIATLFTFLVAPHIAYFYEDPSLTLMFHVCSILFLIDNAMLVSKAELERELRFKELSLINMFANISQGMLILALALYGYGYWSLIIGIVYGHSIKTLLILYVQKPLFSLSFDFTLYKEAVSFGVKAAGAVILWIVFTTVDDVVV